MDGGRWTVDAGSGHLITQSNLGRALGLSKQAISKLKGQGMPVDSVAAAQSWREARQNVAQRKPAPPESKPVTRPWSSWGDGDAEAPRVAVGGVPVFGGGPVGLPEFPDEDRDAARTRREIAEANIAEMNEERLRRELIRVSAVQTHLATDYATTRDAMLQIPSRMAPLLAAEQDPAAVQNLLHAEIHQALMQLAGSADRVTTIEGAFD